LDRHKGVHFGPSLTLRAIALAVKLQREEDERKRIAALEEAERRRIAAQEEERRRWARQQHEREEQAREQKLLGELERWRLARDIREYVNDTLDVVNEHGGVAGMSLSLRWKLAWTLRYARSVDPRTPLKEELRRIAAQAATEGSGKPNHPAVAD